MPIFWTSWCTLSTFRRHDVQFDVRAYYLHHDVTLMSWCKFDVMTHLLTSWFILDIMPNFFITWRIFDVMMLVWRHDVSFDVIRYFWLHDIFLMYIWCQNKTLTSWHTFWCHDVLIDVMTLRWRIFNVIPPFKLYHSSGFNFMKWW